MFILFDYNAVINSDIKQKNRKKKKGAGGGDRERGIYRRSKKGKCLDEEIMEGVREWGEI